MPHRRAFLRTVRWAALAALVFFSTRAPASENDSQREPGIVTATERKEAIERVLKLLDDNYVFPESAAKMRRAIEQRVENKEYDGISLGHELARKLTAHLQEVSRDKHLRVNYSSENRGKSNSPGKLSAADRERFRAQQRMVNAGFQKVERLPANVGYLDLRGFMDFSAAAEPLAAAMNFLANTDALIIDMRHNNGGNPRTVALVCSYFFDENPVHLNSLYWRKGDRTEEFWTLKSVAGKRYLKKDVFILTSNRTFSAAEEFTYNMQCLRRATIVGETTGGGAHPGGRFPVGEHFSVFVPTGRAINPITKTNWEGTGVKPDIAVPADKALEAAHQEAVKRLLAGAKDDEIRKLIQSDLERGRVQSKEKKVKAPIIAQGASPFSMEPHRAGPAEPCIFSKRCYISSPEIDALRSEK